MGVHGETQRDIVLKWKKHENEDECNINAKICAELLD